jgi:purine-cytosine permease-like protein
MSKTIRDTTTGAQPQAATALVTAAASGMAVGAEHDYTTAENGIVPLSERKPWFHFASLWLTLESGFTYILPGIALHAAGLSLAKSAMYLLLGMAIYLAYGMAAAHIGARSGQTVTLLSRSILGSAGSGIVSLFLIITQTGWAGFQAYFTVDLLNGLFGWGLAKNTVMAFGCLASVLMVINNVVGFHGIASFARKIVTPILLAWTFYLLFKGIISDGSLLKGTPETTSALGIGPAMALIIGTAIWGAEADIWRYSKPEPKTYAASYGFAFGAGVVVSGLCGWIAAQIVLSGDAKADTGLSGLLPWMTKYSLFDAKWLMLIVVLVVQVSLNDGNYYESINALQNVFSGIKGWTRRYSCALVAVLGVIATLYVNSGSNIEGFSKIATFGAIGAPCATVIMAVDHFLLPRIFGISRPLVRVPSWAESGRINVPGVVALLVAVAYGIVTTGVFSGGAPGWYWSSWGVAALETWLLAAVLYIVLTGLVRGRNERSARQVLGFPSYELDTIVPNRPVDIVSPA